MDILNSNKLSVGKSENLQNKNKTKISNQNESDVKFFDELKNVTKTAKTEETDDNKSIDSEKTNEKTEVNKAEDIKKENETSEISEKPESVQIVDGTENVEYTTAEDKPDNEKKEIQELNVFEETRDLDKKSSYDFKDDTIYDGFANQNAKADISKEEKDTVEIVNIDNAISGLNTVLDEITTLNQKEENKPKTLKQTNIFDDKDKNKEDLTLIDNNMNIQEPQDKINLQMGANMQFNSDGQPFAEFVKSDNKEKLKINAKDIAEEKAIMSTMEENIAIANKNMAMAKTKTVENEHGVQKIDRKTNLVVDTIVNYDRVVMDKADVDFFANLVENGFVDLKEVQGAEKSSRVSKALADLIAKAMNENKPVRIDFDNNISVIIKIDRAGKISADFLPSSQVAEAYLKENLPLLRQRFDDNNIDYNELNQRQRKQENQDNRRKGRKDE